MEKELNRKIFGTKKRGSRSLRKPRTDKQMMCNGKLCAYQDVDDDQV